MSNDIAVVRRPWLAVALLAGIIELPGTAGTMSALADSGPDTRVVIELNADERTYVLENMRFHMADVLGVVDALAAGDSAGALRAATNLGTLANKQNTKRPNGMAAKFPKDFVTATQEFHKEFDVVADGMAHGDNAMQSMRRLANAMQTCVACHASYKIEVSTP